MAAVTLIKGQAKSADSAPVGGSAMFHVQIKVPEKYSLRPRSIAKRIEVEQKKHIKRTPKPKQKPAPLSKYRRRTANARERTRMKEINQAFETLRKAIPEPVMSYQSSSPSPCSSSSSSSSSSSGSSSSLEKWTKITTLRLAMNYIEALTQVLDCSSSDAGDELVAGSSAADLAAHGLAAFGRTLAGGSCCGSDLLSEASGDPSIDTFDDIPMGITMNLEVGDDAFDIFGLDGSDGDSLHFHSDLTSDEQTTP